MEKKRNKLLLVAFILGVCFLFFTSWAFYAAIVNVDVYERIYEVFLESGTISNRVEFFELLDENEAVRNSAIKAHKEWEVWLIILAISSLFSISAVLFNFFGWRKTNNKFSLIASILYFFSINIISAVICFVSSRKGIGAK